MPASECLTSSASAIKSRPKGAEWSRDLCAGRSRHDPMGGGGAEGVVRFRGRRLGRDKTPFGRAGGCSVALEVDGGGRAGGRASGVRVRRKSRRCGGVSGGGGSASSHESPSASPLAPPATPTQLDIRTISPPAIPHAAPSLYLAMWKGSVPLPAAPPRQGNGRRDTTFLPGVAQPPFPPDLRLHPDATTRQLHRTAGEGGGGH